MRKAISNNRRFMRNEAYVAEPLRIKLIRLTREGQSPEDIALASGVTLLYTKGRRSVYPETDIRTDKWEVAQDAMQRAYNNARKPKTKEGKSESETTQGPQDTPNEKVN